MQKKPLPSDKKLVPSCAAIIVAAGSGTRALAGDAPDSSPTLAKQFWQLGPKIVLAYSLDYFTAHPRIAAVIVVLPNYQISRIKDLIVSSLTPVHVVVGGATRQDSVRAGLNALQTIIDPDSITHVAIHDAARPLIPATMLDRLLTTLEIAEDDKTVGVIPILPFADSIKTLNQNHMKKGRIINSGLNRSKIAVAQTPQLFNLKTITSLHQEFADQPGFTDDCSLAEKAGFKILAVDGAKQLMKLTDIDDFFMLKHWANRVATTYLSANKAETNNMTETRHGTGFDVHKFDHEAGPIWLAGIKLDSDRRMLAHSDGDVGLHALCDAIFGALADGDIGSHFPPSEPQWKNANSADFLTFAMHLLAESGGTLIHLDLTFICESPRIGPHRDAMRARISEICGLSIDRVSVKATTSEGLGFTGRGEGIAAHASVSIALPTLPETSTKPNQDSQG